MDVEEGLCGQNNDNDTETKHTPEDLHQYDEYAGHNTWFEEPRHYGQNGLLVLVYDVPEEINVVFVAFERTAPTGRLASEV